MKEQISNVLAVFGTFAVFIIVWQEVVVLLHIPNIILPTPYLVFTSGLINNWKLLLGQTAATAEETVLGFLGGVALGIGCAILIHFSKTLRSILYPPLVFLNILPKSAIAPLLILWFGLGILPKVVIALFISFFPILINSLAGLRSASPEMINLGQSLEASRFRVFRVVEFPNALPQILNGLKIAITLALVGAIVAEFVGANSGIGLLILVSQYNLKSSLMFASLLVVGLLGMGLFGVIVGLERILVPWYWAMRRRT